MRDPFLILFLAGWGVNDLNCVDISSRRATIKKSSARRSCSPQRANRVDIRFRFGARLIVAEWS
jgi:hypothetical protein